MAQLSRLESAITSAVGVAASRLGCADPQGQTENLYSLHLFMVCSSNPEDYLLNRATQLYTRRKVIPSKLLGELSLWIDANLISRLWILDDIETRNTISALYSNEKAPEQLHDTDLVGSVISVKSQTDLIVKALMKKTTSPASTLLQKSVDPVHERVRYVPGMFQKAFESELEGDTVIRLLRSAAYGGLPCPGGIADIEFRLSTLTDNDELVSRVTQFATKRGLLSGLNEALGLFPNSLVRIMIDPKSMVSIRTSIFGAHPPPSRPSGFETTWDVKSCRVGRLPPVHRLNERMVRNFGGIDNARALFRKMMTFGDTTPIETPHDLWMLEYCVQTSQSIKLVPACFSGTAASACVCLGCMTVLTSYVGGTRRQSKNGVVMTPEGSRCSVCASSAIIDVDLTNKFLVIRDGAINTTLCVCSECGSVSELSRIVGAKPYCSAHAPPAPVVDSHCAMCALTLYRPDNCLIVDSKPVTLCSKHRGVFTVPWVTKTELHAISQARALPKSRPG